MTKKYDIVSWQTGEVIDTIDQEELDFYRSAYELSDALKKTKAKARKKAKIAFELFEALKRLIENAPEKTWQSGKANPAQAKLDRARTAITKAISENIGAA